MTTDTFDENSTDAEDNITNNDDLELDLDSIIKEVVLEENTIKAPEPTQEAPSLVSVADGVIGTGKVKKEAPKPKLASKEGTVSTVALFASRNISWNGLGKLVKGYNLVPAEAAKQWLTLDSVKAVTPEEIKTNLG